MTQADETIDGMDANFIENESIELKMVSGMVGAKYLIHKRRLISRAEEASATQPSRQELNFIQVNCPFRKGLNVKLEFGGKYKRAVKSYLRLGSLQPCTRLAFLSTSAPPPLVKAKL